MKKLKKIDRRLQRRQESYESKIKAMKEKGYSTEGYHRPGSRNLNKH